MIIMFKVTGCFNIIIIIETTVQMILSKYKRVFEKQVAESLPGKTSLSSFKRQLPFF